MKKILLIDDDEDIIELITIILTEKYEVESQTNHFNVAAKLLSFAPDLILLDNNMGIYSAADIIPQLRGANGQNTVPVILFSAHHQIAQIAQIIGANAYLSKPFDLEKLYTCIDGLLDQTLHS